MIFGGVWFGCLGPRWGGYCSRGVILVTTGVGMVRAWAYRQISALGFFEVADQRHIARTGDENLGMADDLRRLEEWGLSDSTLDVLPVATAATGICGNF